MSIISSVPPAWYVASYVVYLGKGKGQEGWSVAATPRFWGCWFAVMIDGVLEVLHDTLWLMIIRCPCSFVGPQMFGRCFPAAPGVLYQNGKVSRMTVKQQQQQQHRGPPAPPLQLFWCTGVTGGVWLGLSGPEEQEEAGGRRDNGDGMHVLSGRVHIGGSAADVMDVVSATPYQQEENNRGRNTRFIVWLGNEADNLRWDRMSVSIQHEHLRSRQRTWKGDQWPGQLLRIAKLKLKIGRTWLVVCHSRLAQLDVTGLW